MADTTIGQRIAGERKKLGLSQEALGEKMGVSRQAISKWEADAAVPEIDKLIALSRLFSVSLNWLLGVEEECLPPAQSTPPEAPSPETAGHTASLPGWLRRFGGLALLGIAVFFLIWLLVRALNSNASNYQFELMNLHSYISQLESRVAALELAQSTAASAGSLLADHSFDIELVENTHQAAVVFTAVPHSWQAEDQAYLYIIPPKISSQYLIDGKSSGIETIAVPCTWDGTSLTAATVLEFSDGYSLCFTLEHSDGSRQMQVLSDSTLENLYTAFVPTLSGSVESAVYLPEENALELKKLYISYSRTGYGPEDPVTWKQVSVVLHADGEEVTRLDHLNGTDTSGGGSWWTVSETLLLNGFTPEPGQTLELRLCAEMSNGISASEPICSWTVGPDGSLRS